MVSLSTSDKRISGLFCNLALMMITINCAAGFYTRQHGLETNDVVEEHHQEHHRLSECQPDSVCNYLDVNVKGVNVKPLCRCAGLTSCPSFWDPLDGRSITQGSTQYKFCKRAPQVPTCSPNDVAFSSYVIYSKLTDEKLSTVENIYCTCPEFHNYGPNKYSSGNHNEIMDYEELKYSCVPIPSCHRDSDFCKSITVTDHDFLVNTNCLCPENLSCPTVSYRAFDFLEYGKGKIYRITCQKI